MAQINTGDTAWMLVSAAMVLFMTPGLALFYGGMVRRKNVLDTMMQSFFLIGLVTILWILFGYSLAFGPDKWHLIGDLSMIGLRGVGQAPNKEYAPSIPQLSFMIYQGMFAIITPALITGAFAERMKFKAFVLFTIAWVTLVYSPMAHWVWGVGGWIRQMGALDFAGGTVVHISSAAAALAAAIIVGRRKGWPKEAFVPHNLPMTALGAGILWFGWFGFNAGSALSAGGLASSAFVATHISAAAGLIGWSAADWIKHGKTTILGGVSGSVAGLVAITPASGYVGPMPALIIGLAAGAACFWAVTVKFKFGYDDSLDVVGVHGVGGTIGALATGIFASKAINAAGANGLLFGNPSLLGIQAISIVATIAFSFTMSFVILKAVDALVGLRVTEDAEDGGLDIAEHDEAAYEF